jgi:NAD(P)-dependent dehydrogenase (short-subunit alcohol dehydrogenase family)
MACSWCGIIIRANMWSARLASVVDAVPLDASRAPGLAGARPGGRGAALTGRGGLATAKRLAHEGTHAGIADICDEERGQEAAEAVGRMFVRTDVTMEEDVQNLFRATKQTYGRVDIAFDNAGISPAEDASILETGIEPWRQVPEANLTSVYYC